MDNKTTTFKANKDKTFVITGTFSVDEVTKTYDKVLASAQANFESKGFRKGKAPLNIVKENIHEHRIIEEILTTLITKLYSDVVTENKLHPIVQPQIKVVNPPLELDKEWKVEMVGCELPVIELAKDYQDDIKKVNSTATDENDRLNQTIASLIKNAKVEVPEMLIKNDVENKMSQLVDQTQQAGLTVNSYLKSKNTTLEKYQEELTIQITQEWITNLCIDHIAKTNNITVSDKEVDEVISKNKDLARNLNLVYYLLTQQKVFEFLKSLK
ncbi:MAG: trigger factor [Candidatus Shapirobacteria bacterium]|jgi:FKBP-type peptidyl-prolyl cis-trans isomerase (trigger factor)